MPVLDPTGFQIFVKVIDAATGTEFPLWTRSQQNVDKIDIRNADLSVLDLPIVESVDIELNLGLNGKTTIAIAAPFELGLALLDSSIFRIGNVYEVQIGYPKIGRFTPWFAAIATKPSIRIDPSEGLTATLNGDGGAFSSMRTGSKKKHTGSYRDAIRDISIRHDWSLKLPDVKPGSPLDKDRDGGISQQGFSDWIFIQQITRNANCDAFIQPDPDDIGRTKLVVRRRSDDTQARPTRTFSMRQQTDFDKVFPIFEFESDAIGAWLPPAQSSVVSFDIDPTTRDAVRNRANSTSSDVAGTNETGVGSGSTKVEDTKSELVAEERSDADAGEHNHVSSRDPRKAEDVNQAHRDEAAFRGGLNATVVTFGIPEQFPGDLVAVQGVGQFDGKYRITGLSHRAMAGEWSMTMQLLSNSGSSRWLSAHLEQQLPQSNQEEAPEAEVNDDSTGGGTEVDPEPA